MEREYLRCILQKARLLVFRGDAMRKASERWSGDRRRATAADLDAKIDKDVEVSKAPKSEGAAERKKGAPKKEFLPRERKNIHIHNPSVTDAISSFSIIFIHFPRDVVFCVGLLHSDPFLQNANDDTSAPA